ncbi:MAG: hypothetical protein NTU74_05715 [Deltaproteobacteria bacterium]|nr:hypothetical protein [Deltaproteobacteria bacterium]
MNLFKRMVILLGLLLTLAVPVLAQTINSADDCTILKEIIIFGRHSIRASTSDPTSLAPYAVDPYPDFTDFTGVLPPGYLTPRGQQAAGLLGSYFHDYLLQEGLLTGDAQTDLSRAYFRANSIQRSNITAAKFGAGLIPGATTIPVHSYSIADGNTPAVPDPVFDPILALPTVVTVDTARAVAEVQGIFSSGTAIASAYSGELSLIRSALYPPGTQPIPWAPRGSIDPTSQPITLTASTSTLYTGGVINIGGLNLTNSAIDPFVMQYADNFSLQDVAWGRFSLDALSQHTRIFNLIFNIEMLSPYLNQVQSSNAASHVLRTLEQAVLGEHLALPGIFGNSKSRVHVIISSDGYVIGLAGLLHLHWMLNGYQQDYCAPGGALVFELRQVAKTKEYLVRVFYTAQTFDQLRNLTPRTLETPPASMQLTVPGGSKSSTNLDVKFSTFKNLLMEAMDQKYVQPFCEEDPPGVLTGVPLE